MTRKYVKKVIDTAVQHFFGDDINKVTEEYLYFIRTNGITKKRIINVSHSVSMLKARVLDSSLHSMYYYFSILLTYQIYDTEINQCKRCTKLINQVQEHIELGHKRRSK